MLNLKSICILLLAVSMAGCQQPGGSRQPLVDLSQRPRLFNFGNPAYTAANDRYEYNRSNGTQGWGSGQQGGQQFANLADQVQSLNNRLGQFDSDNQQLITELASLKQKLQVANDYNFQLKQQLADTTGQLQQMQTAKVAAEQKMANFQFQLEQLGADNQKLQAQQASTGGSQVINATLRANNSLMQKLPQLQIPGAQARMDGDVIRVEIPTDQLFNSGSYQINAAHVHVLQNLANSIRQNFPRQIIGVESHWDGTQIQPPTTDHQLTASQSLAVFDYFKQLGLPKNQLFTMAMGSNRPRHPQGANNNGISPNRRVEVVIYPETYDGN